MQKAHDSSYNNYWKNKPNITTPIVQDQLNRIETTIDEIDDRVVTYDTTKANQSDLLADIKNVTFDSTTGTFTFTKQNNTTIVIDTDIEKIAVNFDYDDDPTSAHYQNLIITLDDGTVKYVDMSALITEYEFTDSSAIHFTITSGNVSASIINGSITEEKLQPNFLADCRAAKTAAETAETNAETAETGAQGYKREAEAWAVGTKDGVPVPPSADQYNNNSQYWAAQARAIVGDKVDSFNGRTGTVVAEDGDYESGMIVPATGAIVGQVPVVRNVGTGQEVKLRYVNEDYQSGILPHIIVISETGSTVSAVKGGTTVYATETTTGHFEVDVPEFGTWTIHSLLSGDDATVSLVVDAVKVYTVDDDHYHADITVTYPSGGTCSCSQSGQTTLYATGSPYTFTVHTSGTWTITATANGKTFTEDVVITASGQTESLTLPEGSTVTPTDDVSILIACAGIGDSEITTVSGLLADTTTLSAVINSTNAIDYLVRSTTFSADITADSTAMSYIGLNNYAANTLLGANNPPLVPIMTSNTTPSGVVSADSERNTNYAYKAFDGNISDLWQSTKTKNAEGVWLQYQFTEAKTIRRLKIYWNSDYWTSCSYKLQKSNDGTTWTDVESFTDSISSSGWVEHSFSNSGSATYYRIYITSQTGTAANAGNVHGLQFYEEAYDPDVWLEAICNSTYFESVLNAKVPTMTDNTTPSGTAFDSLSSASAFSAFSGGSGFSLPTGNVANYVGYAFTREIRIFKYAYKGRDAGTYTIANTWSVECLVDSDWTRETDIFTDSTTVKTGIISGGVSTNGARIKCYSANTYVGESWFNPNYQTYYTSIQFYGREDV